MSKIDKTILLVEDDPMIAFAETAVLEKYNYEIINIDNGEQAIEILNRNSQIDLILMDINLGPGIDGTVAAQKILKDHDIPLIFLSSHTERSVVEKTEGITSYGYIVKNSGETVLIASIKMAFRLYDARKKEIEKENRLRATLNSIGDAVLATDSTGNVTSMNPVAIQLTGHSFEEAAGKPLHEIFNIIDSKSRKVCEDPVQKVLLSGTVVGLANHTLLISKSGQEYQISDSASPIINEQGAIEGVVLVFRDITRDYELQESLKESQERLNLAVATAKLGYFDWKPADGPVHWDTELHKIFELDPRSDVDRFEYFYKHVHPDDVQLIQSEFEKSIDPSNPELFFQSNHRFLMPSGKLKYLASCAQHMRDTQGVVTRIIGTFQDITDRKLTEEALAQNEKRLRALVDNAPICIHEIDLQGRIISMNSSGLKMMGLKSESNIYNMPYLDAVNEADKANVARLLERAIAGLAATFEFASPKKESAYFSSSFVPLKDDAGQVQRLMGITSNITEVKKLLREKEALMQEAHHRIKNNVLSISSLLNLQADSTDNEEAIYLLQEAIGRINTITVLYDKLLQANHFAESSVKTYIKGIVTELVKLYSLPDNIEIQTDLEDFNLDSKRLVSVGMIVNELVTNSLKYAFIKGKSGYLKVSIKQKDEVVLISIDDNGVGLPEGFDRTTTNSLGIALVEMLAQQLQGKFVLESIKGLQANVEFPI